MTSYKYEVSASGIKSILSDTFSISTWLSELAQNAQRSGAKRLDIHYDEGSHSLVVKDDGCGFDDDSWKAYFTVASSGWDQSVIDSQRPFGIGCASLLYACTSFNIFSRSNKVIVSTEEFLEGGEVQVVPSDSFVKGSIFEIALKDSVKFNGCDLSRVFGGFQIPVWYNDVEIARPFSLDVLSLSPSLILVDFEFGQISVKPIQPDCSGGNALSVDFFLQGLRVDNISSDFYNNNIVHLESTKVRARVPDRAELVGDVAAVKASCNAAISSSYHRQLSAILDDIGIDAFANQYWRVAMLFSPDLLSSAPVPLSLLWGVNSLAYGEDFDDDHYKEYLGDGFLREQDSRIVVAEDGLYIYSRSSALESVSEFNRLNFLYASKLPVINRGNLPAGHWLIPRLVSLDEAVFSVVATDFETITIDAAGFWRHSMVLCTEYAISVSGAFNEHGDVSLPDFLVKDKAMVFNGVSYMPAGESDFENFCRQCCNVMCGDNDYPELDQAYLDDIVAELTSVLLSKRGGSVEDLLKKFLDEHADELSYFDDLPNQRFSLSFSGDAKPAAIVSLAA